MNPLDRLRSKLSFCVLLLFSILNTCLSQNEDCISRISDLIELEEAVTDYSLQRTYVICPLTIYEIGARDLNHDLVGFQVQPSIPLRPNLHLKCGETGERSNLCWIANGDIHIDGTNVMGVTQASIENVVLEGFVFINSRRYSTWATKPGDITFRDCEWRDHTHAVAPVLLDFFDGTPRTLSVKFENCLFTGNTYFGRGSHTSLVYANSAQNELSFRQTKFENNNMLHNNTLASTNSFLIETLGSLSIENSCFENNAVGVSNIVVFGSSLASSGIFANNSTGNLCDHASVFQTLQQFDRFSPLCVDALEDACVADFTPSPSTVPSVVPTPHPTIETTISQTKSPTEAPVMLPPVVPPSAGGPPTIDFTPTQPIPPVPDVPVDFTLPPAVAGGASRLSFSVLLGAICIALMWN